MSGSSDSSGSTLYAMIPNPNSNTLTLPTKTIVKNESSINIPLHPRQPIPSTSSSASATSGSGQSNESIPTSSLGKSLNCLTSQSLTNLPSCGSEPPNISSNNFYQGFSRTSSSFKPDPSSIIGCSQRDALHKESECLLTQIPKPSYKRNNDDDSTGATIFDLKFEDRQRVAALIRDLANAHEQVEILESRLAVEGDRFQKEYQKQVDIVKELSSRCQVLSAALKQGQTSVLQKELDGFRRENQEFRLTIATMESTNSTIKESYNNLERKYVKSTEDNKRLKWILKTIQEREEILLQNKCHATEKVYIRHSEETESPSNIVILKGSRNESISSSHVPYGMLENKGSADFSTSAKPSQQTVQSGGDYQEFPVYEPHLVIPPMATPVIMKIPRSPLVGGQSSLRPQATHSEPYQRQINTDNRRVNQTRSNPEDIRNTHLDPHEEEILRELFFTF